ncbi:leucine-rich repeat-containing protein 59-like [Penaeus japonicus]|uniref:leucine-rich repeat-containing protein 59-like n=1 Tax=Penaeus japonicus TaxID=27405 RepID=UPI001C70FA48|nr:leucine-rich repeat-containing protein 59-like [Penaeus japonicus]
MAKNNLRDKLDGDELDLSMMSLTEVPVKDIAALPRATKIDLSNNQLTILPSNFATALSNITRVDLSSNKLKELPSNINHLQNLQYLDLYNNQLTDLPVTFCQLRRLKWLDLKGNNLNPALRKAAGDCLNKKECEAAARNVIAHLKQRQAQMENERLQRLKREEEMEAARQRAEEEKQAKKRAERKAAKEKKKAEQAPPTKVKAEVNGRAPVPQKIAAPKSSNKKEKKKSKQATRSSFLGWLNLLLLVCLMGTLAGGVYLYTDGDFSQKGLNAAFTKMLENSQKLADLTAEAFQPENLKMTAQTVGKNIAETSAAAWATLEEYTGDLSVYTTPVINITTEVLNWLKAKSVLCYDWICNNVDWAYIVEIMKSAMNFLHEQWLFVCEELSKNKAFMSGVETIRTHAASVLEFLTILWASVCKQLGIVVEYIQEEGPGILATVKEQATGALHAAKQSLEGLVK